MANLDLVSPDFEPVWYVVHTHALLERMVCDALLRKGFGSYLPAVTKIVRPAGRPQVVARPLFPRYLFVGLDPDFPAFAEVRKTNGVQWLITNALNPVRVPTRAIEVLRAAEKNGFFDETKPKAPAFPFKPGDRVELSEGPFANLPAEVMRVSSDHRAELMLSMFGAKTKVVTHLATLRKVS